MLPLRASLPAFRALPSPAAAVVRLSAAVTSRVPAATRSYHDKDMSLTQLPPIVARTAKGGRPG